MGKRFPVCILALWAAFCASSHAITTIDSDSTAQALALQLQLQSVGMINNSGDITTGVLIDNQWVLTAAHIAAGNPAQNAFTFTINGTVYSSDAYYKNPSSDPSVVYNGFDLMLIHLTTPVAGVTPATLYTGSSEVGGTGTLVGFGVYGTGSTGAGSSGRGTERAATNDIDVDTLNYTIGTTNYTTHGVLLYDFDSGLAADNLTGSQSQTTDEGLLGVGDSGGGTFEQIGGVWYLVGIHSFTSDYNNDGKVSGYGDLAGDTRVSTNSTWIPNTITSVPEPGAFLMLLPGIAGILAVKRLRRRNTAQ